MSRAIAMNMQKESWNRCCPPPLLAGLAAAALACLTSIGSAQSPSPARQAPATSTEHAGSLTETEATEIGVEAVVYGLPLVIVDITKQVQTNVAEPDHHGHVPANQFSNFLKYPTAAYKDIVRLNVDTLYSFAWLDLSKEPIVLSVPDTKDRYYLMPIMDAWTNVFASPGKRTTGTKAGDFAIVGPNWKGTLPDGVKEVLRADERRHDRGPHAGGRSHRVPGGPCPSRAIQVDAD